MVGDSKPKNWADLVERLETRYREALDEEYVRECCSTSWDRLRRCKESQGELLEALGHHAQGGGEL